MMDLQEALIWLFPSHKQTASKEQLRQAHDIIEDSHNYRALSVEEGRQIALLALDLYDAGERDGYHPHQILTHLSAVVPGSLKDLYLQILARDLYWQGGILFWEADAQLRDHLITLVETGTEDPAFHPKYHLLRSSFTYISLLAWMGDKVVQAAIDRWKEHSPPHLPHPEDLLVDKGWVLTTEGQRRELYHTHNYDIDVVLPTQTGPALSSLVQVGGSLSERCGWCGRTLALFLDLDLTDSRLAMLWPQGERLRIALCLNCSLQYEKGNESVYMDIDGQGLARWSTLNGPLPTFPALEIWAPKNPDYVEAFPIQPCVLGERRRTPYENQGSHLGGSPDWVQGGSSYYPPCPLCKQLMTFVGQYDLRLVTDEQLNNFAYLMAFVCVPCGKSTTGYIS